MKARLLLPRCLSVCTCLTAQPPPAPLDTQHHVINWVDSKAMYGSRETYLSEVLPQVTRYVNRFGPGCVVFWWGFDDAIRALPSARHDNVVLLDDFPPRDGGGQRLVCL